MDLIRRWSVGLFALGSLQALQLRPDTADAYDRYIKLTEADARDRSGKGAFLWLDQHRREKSLVWLNQNFVTAHRTLDREEEIPVPNGAIQDWMGEIFLPGVTVEQVRDVLLDFARYKKFFPSEMLESRLEKREGDHFEAFLRFSKRQISKVMLNAKCAVQYEALDPSHVSIVARSTHIGEVRNPGRKPYEEEQPVESEYGFLWRLTWYWRLEQADGGVYAELEVISLSKDEGLLGRGRLLNGFVDRFSKDLTQDMTERTRQLLASGR